jgi:MFS family permease
LAPLLWSEGISNFGSMLSRLAVPWLAALELQASPWAMAWLLVAQVGSGALAALLLAPAVDRGDARRWMLRADAGAASVLAALATAHAAGALTLGGLVLAALASGGLASLFDLARSAWVARQVPVGELPRRNAQLAAVGSASETLAFASGGWLYQALGAVLALLLDALSFVASALCLRRLPAAESTTGVAAVRGSGRLREHVQATLAGWPVLRADMRLRWIVAIEALLALATAAFGACFMVFVSRTLGYATGPLGLVFALGGLGALAGAALAPRLGRRFGPAAAMALGLLLLAAGQLAAALAPPAAGAAGAAADSTFWVGLGLLVVQQVVGDSGQLLHEIHGRSLRQALPPPALRARVDAAMRSVGHAATLVGALLGGAAATAWGERPVLAGAAACVGLAALLAATGLRTAMRRGPPPGGAEAVNAADSAPTDGPPAPPPSP